MRVDSLDKLKKALPALQQEVWGTLKNEHIIYAFVYTCQVRPKNVENVNIL